MKQASALVKEHIKSAQKPETFHTMIETQNHAWIDSMLTSPIVQKLAEPYRTQDHTQSTNETSGIAELWNGVLDYSNPDYLAREIASIHSTQHESERIRLPSRGRAIKTSSNVTSIQATGGDLEFLEVKADKEFVANAEWNRQQLEDASSYIVAQSTQSTMDALMYIESKEIIDFLYSLRADTGHAGRITKAGVNDNPSMDLLIDLWGLVKKKDRMPTAYVMSPATCTALLKDDDLKNSEYFSGHNANYSTGMIGNFLGSKILVSSLVKDNFIACLDTNITLIYLLRRDTLPISYMEQKDDLHGIRLSTRYGLSKGRADGMAVWY